MDLHQRSGSAWRRLRLGLAAGVAIAALAAPAAVRADYFEGLSAYERQDYAVALQQLEPLAEQGDRRAQRLLGTMYAEGRGVVQDFVQAHRWYNLAAAAGDPDAPALRDAVARQMTSEQIAQAQQLAAASGGRPGSIAPAAGPSTTVVLPEPVTTTVATTHVAQNYGTLGGGEVRQLQRELTQHGYNTGGADGVIGPKTRAAIRHYQADAGLEVTGEADAALLEHVLYTSPPVTNAAPPRTVVKKATTQGTATRAKEPIYRPVDEVNHAYVITIQQELASKGFNVGPVDGAVGPRTRQAIRDYQTRAGLPVTGEPSLELLNHIRLIGAY